MRTSKSSVRPASTPFELAAVLGRRGPITVSVAGASARVGPDVAAALREVVDHLLAGDEVAVVARRAELSTQEAADLLGLSRQHVVRLVDAGKLSVRVTKAGAHRRLAAADVLRLKAEREAEVAHARALADLFEREGRRIEEERRGRRK